MHTNGFLSGASNPSGIARPLIKACDEARRDPPYQDGKADRRRDTAIKLILHRLCFLAGIISRTMRLGKDGKRIGFDYGEAMTAFGLPVPDVRHRNRALCE